VALDILILSVLRGGSMHGYELKRQVQRPTSAPLSNNSLYPYLKRFEELGAVTATVEVQEGRPARRIYALTDAGRTLFHDLVSTLPADRAGDEEEFLVRLSFFHEIDSSARTAILDARLAALDARVEQVAALAAGESVPEWRGIALAHLLERVQHERSWVDGLGTMAGERVDVATGH
jgi:DNA-binding PadR family transcriptional regulator